MHAHTSCQTWGWHVRKKGGAPTPATSFSLSLSLSFFSLPPLSLSVEARSLHSCNALSIAILFSLILPSPHFLPFPSRPLASFFAAALSSSLLSCEKGWFARAKKGASQKGEGAGMEWDGASGVEALPPTGVDKTSGGCSERSPVSSRIIRSFTGYQ